MLANLHHHIKRHAKNFVGHMKLHHKKYIFGAIWGGLFMKLAIFMMTGLWVSVSITTHADVESGCYTTGEYLTGWYYTWSYYTWEYLTGWYRTEGYLVDDVLTGQEYTWEYLTGWYRTGEYYTWDYLTWGVITWCTALVCDANDIVMLSPLSGNVLTGAFRITWDYTTEDCELSGNIKQLTVQLRTHNSQRIDVSTVDSTSSDIAFDSTTLVTGQYTWYKIRIIDGSGSVFYTWDTDIFAIDNETPTLTGLAVSGDNQSWFKLLRNTSENTRYVLAYTISGSTENVATGTVYWTSFNYLLTGFNTGASLIFKLDIMDNVSHTRQLSGTITLSASGIATFSWVISWSTVSATTWTTLTWTTLTWTILSWNIASFALTLQNEINKFNECRDSVDYRTIDLQIQEKNFTLRMPKFEKDTIKTLVQAFTVFMVSTLKRDASLTESDLTLLTKKFNNILIILKLVRDNDNECKQNLSNYHILQFQKTMAEYDINI